MVTEIRHGARPHLYIDEWMTERGVSLDKMAGRIGVARNTIWRWKTEQHRLNPEKIAALATALDLQPEDLWRPPGRQSIDAVLAESPDDLYATAFDIVTRLAKRAS
jgi:transcriptional regulator with XRE-family HTH domain